MGVKGLIRACSAKISLLKYWKRLISYSDWCLSNLRINWHQIQGRSFFFFKNISLVHENWLIHSCLLTLKGGICILFFRFCWCFSCTHRLSHCTSCCHAQGVVLYLKCWVLFKAFYNLVYTLLFLILLMLTVCRANTFVKRLHMCKPCLG